MEDDKLLIKYTREKIMEYIFVNNVTMDMIRAMVRDDKTDVRVQNHLMSNLRLMEKIIKKRDAIIRQINNLNCGKYMDCKSRFARHTRENFIEYPDPIRKV